MYCDTGSNDYNGRTMTDQGIADSGSNESVKKYAKYLLFMAGLGGLLYGMDVGIISHALPYIRQTTTYSDGDISQVVAAVLLGSVLSSLFAGWMADKLGRKWMIVISAALFLLSIPVICWSDNNLGMLMGGRILMGISGGLLGVVVPLYLAECLGASERGKGTGMFQLMLTIGLVFTALIGSAVTYYFGPADAANVAKETKEWAWQLIFWVSALPGIVLVLGALFLSESPRWLYQRGKEEDALKSLSRNNPEDEAKAILEEMRASDEADKKARAEMAEAAKGDSLLQKKYIVPFVLAVVILACTQATGINSVLNYSVEVFQQSGLGEKAGIADIAIKVTNVVMTLVAMTLVDKKGRKFLLKLGTIGIIVGLAGVGGAFYSFEGDRTDVLDKIKVENNALNIDLSKPETQAMLGLKGEKGEQLILNVTQGTGTKVYIAEVGKDKGDKIDIKATNWEEPTIVELILPWSGRSVFNSEDPAMATGQPMALTVSKAQVGMCPSPTTGWIVTVFFILFIAFYAVGPGVCVWLALSELMPTRIRSVGMSIGLFINQAVSTTIAGTFLPWAGSWGYSGVFFTLAGCTVIYFITAAFWLPETKGRTLEEIEAYFTTGKMPKRKDEEEEQEA